MLVALTPGRMPADTADQVPFAQARNSEVWPLPAGAEIKRDLGLRRAIEGCEKFTAADSARSRRHRLSVICHEHHARILNSYPTAR